MPNTVIRQVLGPFRGNDIGTALRTLIDRYSIHWTPSSTSNSFWLSGWYRSIPLKNPLRNGPLHFRKIFGFGPRNACDVGHCARPIRRALYSSNTGPEGPRAMTTLRIVVLGCVLAAVAITLKIRLDTPQGPQPLARAIVSTHLQQLRNQLALP